MIYSFDYKSSLNIYMWTVITRATAEDEILQKAIKEVG